MNLSMFTRQSVYLCISKVTNFITIMDEFLSDLEKEFVLADGTRGQSVKCIPPLLYRC